MRKRDLFQIDTIVIHHSASEWGDGAEIDKWHRARGWDRIGYHYVILNGRPHASDQYKAEFDGLIEVGRPLDYEGAHVKGHNANTVGVCLIGDKHFTAKQLLVSLPAVVAQIEFMLGRKLMIVGHRYLAPTECPGFDVSWLRYGFRARTYSAALDLLKEHVVL